MKKALSMLLSFILTLSVFTAIPADRAEAQGNNTVTLYFSNNKYWDSVTAYIWKEGGSEFAAWPGVAAAYEGDNEYGEGIYSVSVDTDVYDTVIFNGSGGQTTDICVEEAAEHGCGIYCLDTQDAEGHYQVGFYAYLPAGSAPVGTSVYLTDSFGWGAGYVYAWNDQGEPLCGDRPGTPISDTTTDDYGQTVFIVPLPQGTVGFNVSNGSGAATEDITDFDSYDGYWMDGSVNNMGQYLVIGYRTDPSSPPAQPSVSYLDADGKAKTANNVTAITSSTTALSTGWYEVSADTEIDSRINCTGQVRLILCDGKTLTAPRGITVSNGNSLTIYAQSTDKNTMGALRITAPDHYNAGIGGEESGTVVINGGTVTATGGSYGAGIGGNHSTVTINGGIVTATGGEYGAGIGGMEGTVTINDGTVTATGGNYGTGIGSDNGSTVTINGGTVSANGGAYGAGIGGDNYVSITIRGGTVIANGSEYFPGIGGASYSSTGTISLSWTTLSDSIYASSYNGTVTLEKDFYVGTTLVPAGVLADHSQIADQTLVPPTTYLDEDGVEHTTGYIPIRSDTTELDAGWYAVSADTEISDRITCNGNVHLILFDGATLTAPEGVAVNDNDRLTVYGQAVGSGTLEITGSGSDDNAGLGGDESCAGGVITINSGTVHVNIDNSRCFAAAIGGGENGEGFVNINGGTVSAYNSSGLGAGIGGSERHSGYVVIRGGNVTASSIGGGERGGGSTLLSWTNLSDSIKADSYVGSVTLDKDFRADSELTPSGSVIDKSTIAGKTLTPPGFTAHSLTLGGDIGINYYALLTDAEIDNGAVVDFLWTVEGVEKTDSVTLTPADKTANGYKATCPVPVAEMTYDVTATLTVGGEELATDTYSVKQYADTILSDVYKTVYLAQGHTQEDYDKLETLITTMLVYGARAQINFNRNTGNLADEGLSYTMQPVSVDMIPSTASDMTEGLDAYGLQYAGTTLVYLSMTSMRHYYTVVDWNKFNAVKDDITFNGEKVTYHTKDGKIYFELQNIAAADLDTAYTLRIGTNEYQSSGLDYVRNCLSSVYVPYATSLLVTATYWYNQAANAYFGR